MGDVILGTNCPGGIYCDCDKCDGCKEFRKLLELKKGVVVYQYNDQRIKHDKTMEIPTPKQSYRGPIATKDAINTRVDDNIIIIVHNSKDKEADTRDFLHDLDIGKVNCLRCREILRRTKTILKNVSTVKNKETIAICDTCKLRLQAPCQTCQKAIRKFKSMEPLVARKAKTRKNAETDIIIMKSSKKLKSYSDIDVTGNIQRKQTETFHQILNRSKSATTLYYKVKLLSDNKCRCLWPQIKTEDLFIKKRTLLDLKKTVLEKTEKHVHEKRKISSSELLHKFTEQHDLPQPITVKIKSPYHSGQQSESILGVGTTGILRRSYSDDSLITSISAITEGIFKKNFQYFFPGQIKKKERNILKVVTKDTKDGIQAETEDKIEKDDKRILMTLEKQHEREAAIEEITQRTELARHQRLSDIDVKTKKIKETSFDVGVEEEEEQKGEGKRILREKKPILDIKQKGKENDENLAKKTDELSKKEWKGEEKERKSEKFLEQRMDKEMLIKGDKISKPIGLEKTEQKLPKKESISKFTRDREGKEKDKLVKGDKTSKQSDTAQLIYGPSKKGEGVSKIREDAKEKKKEKQVKEDTISKQPGTTKTEQNPLKKIEGVQKIRDDGKEKEKLIKENKNIKKPDTAKTEQKLLRKEEVVDKIREEKRGKENEKLIKAEKPSKQPEIAKREQKPAIKGGVDMMSEDKKGKEKEKLIKVEKPSKQPDTGKTEQKSIKKGEGVDRISEDKKRKEKENAIKEEKTSKQPDTAKNEQNISKKGEGEDKKEKKEEKLIKEEKTGKQLDTGKTEQKPAKKEEGVEKISGDKKGKEKDTLTKEETIGKPSDTAKTEQKLTKKGGVINNQEERKKQENEKVIKVDKSTERDTARTEQKQQRKEEGVDKIKEERKGKTDKVSKVSDTPRKQEQREGRSSDKENQETETEKEDKKGTGKQEHTMEDIEPILMKLDKKRKKSEEETIKPAVKTKTMPSQTDAKMLDTMLKNQEKEKLEMTKARQATDTKFAKEMERANALAKKIDEPNKIVDVREIQKNKKEEFDKKNIKEEEHQGKKGDEKQSKKGDEKESKKEGLKGEVNIKDVKIKTQPSGDDLILKLVKTARPPVIKEIKIPPLPKPITIIRKIRRKPSIRSLRSELAMDAESLLRKQTETKKEPEIVFGEEIILEKNVPLKTEPVKATIFESAFKNEKSFPENKRVEPEPEVERKSPVPGVLRYTLSDRKFIDNGWTVLPTQKVLRKINMYRMHPTKPEFDWFERYKGKGPIKYESGEKLAEVTDDGRGKWYYKNGKLALDYYDSEDLSAQQRVVVYSNGEPDDRGRSRPVTVLGMFDHLGSGVVFDHSGKIRLKYNQNEGVILDRELGPATHWLWHSLNDPPELEQIMIDTHLPYKEPEIAALEPPDVKPPKLKDEEMTAIELENIAKTRKARPRQKFTPHQIRMKAMKINNQFSLKVLDQKTIYLLFREGSHQMKINLGMTLDETEILDTRTAEMNDVIVDIDKKPAATESVENLQKSLLNVQRMNRMRTERELRIRPLSPGLSTDKLTTALSKPLRAPLRNAPVEDPSKLSNCRNIPASNTYYSTRLI